MKSKSNFWQGDSILLRSLEEKDLKFYIANKNNPDSIREWLFDEICLPSSDEKIKKSFHEFIDEMSKNDKCIFVIQNDNGEYVGEISVWETFRKTGVFRYGIFILEKFQGNGFGKQALIILLDYYFNELNYQKCAPTAYSFNENSQKFHEKFGFLKEGTLRNDVYTNGKFYDMVCYGMLKEEFNSFINTNGVTCFKALNSPKQQFFLQFD